MSVTVTTTELRHALGRYIRQAQAGDEIVVTSRGRPVIRLVPAHTAGPKRLGVLAGLFEAPDPDEFNATPLELIEAMEGGKDD